MKYSPEPVAETAAELTRLGAEAAVAELGRASVTPPMNPRLAPRLAEADLIVYAPGTQHSSLFPSYLTPGLSDAIAANLKAIKLLVTNIQADAEITGSSAVDIIERDETGNKRLQRPGRRARHVSRQQSCVRRGPAMRTRRRARRASGGIPARAMRCRAPQGRCAGRRP